MQPPTIGSLERIARGGSKSILVLERTACLTDRRGVWQYFSAWVIPRIHIYHTTALANQMSKCLQVSRHINVPGTQNVQRVTLVTRGYGCRNARSPGNGTPRRSDRQTQRKHMGEPERSVLLAPLEYKLDKFHRSMQQEPKRRGRPLYVLYAWKE